MNAPDRSPTITRRHFHRRLAATAAAVGTVAVDPLRAAQADEKPAKTYPPGKYVDVHVHLGQPLNERGELSPEMMLRWMDAHEIAQAVVLSLVSPESWFYPITPRWVLQQTEKHRDRLIPFCTVDPRFYGSTKGIRELIQRYVDLGAKGFGEHKWGGAIDDPRNIDLMHACAEFGLPVLFHMDSIRNTDKPGLAGLEKVLKEVPDGTFIGHANGWWASISGDCKPADMGAYPKAPVAPGGAIDRLMDAYPNIYGDLSAGSGANAIRRDLKFGREFILRRADRLMFGTDYLADKQPVPQFELLDGLELPAEVQAKVFRDNARRVLKL